MIVRYFSNKNKEVLFNDMKTLKIFDKNKKKEVKSLI